MTKEQLISEFSDLVDYYYDKVAECKDINELYELNWYTKDRLVNMSYKAFNETMNQGWCKGKDNETK